MTYDEIMQLSDLNEKEQKLKEFYENEIKVNEWLVDNTKYQKIRFKDRWEYKENGVYHRLNGPAIEFHNGNRGFFYLFGKTMNETEWRPKANQILREKKLKRMIEKRCKLNEHFYKC
ncbi:MAG: hypothetical protein HPY57_13320 [Ignavibacteria bacterium]|nr:hypothetical protein [Bacteroidales bacterium]NPV12761.1 hypothetical protein [Ignavibacteria bacterium]